MTNEVTTGKKNRKRKGLIAIILCCALVAVVAIAAFNATKSASIQLIKVGNIDVSLVDEEGNKATALEFTDYEGEDAVVIVGDEDLTLESVYLQNDSDFDVTMTIELSDAPELIEWTITVGGETYSDTSSITVAAGEKSGAIVITGEVPEDVSNYADMTLNDGMTLTVTATQATTTATE